MQRRMTYLGKRAPAPLYRLDFLAAAYCALSFWLSMMSGLFKPFIYAIPVVAVLAMLATRQFSLPPNAKPYLVLMVGGLLLAPLGNWYGLQDLYLMLMGLSPFFFGYRWRLSWRQVLYAAIIATLFNLAMNRSAFSGGVEFDPLTSRSTFESTTSFAFGVLAVWAMLEKRWRGALLALLLCVLTLKRIVALGAIVCVVVMLLPRRYTDKLLTPIPMLLINGAVLAAVVMYTQGVFDRWVIETIGQSPNQFGMGRQELYRYPVQALMSEPWRFAFIGVGAGGIYDLMKGGWMFLSKANLHNDSMKILIEYGGLIWVAFISLLYWPRQRFELRVMMLFVNILLLTDNALIYSYVIFIISLACHAIVALPAATPGGHPVRQRAPSGLAAGVVRRWS